MDIRALQCKHLHDAPIPLCCFSAPNRGCQGGTISYYGGELCM